MSSAEVDDYLAQDNSLITAIDWADIPLGFRALRVDGMLPNESGYPYQGEWSFSAGEGFTSAASELSTAIARRISADETVHLAAVGDIMLNRSLGGALASGDKEYPFVNVSEVLREADLTVGNLESALGIIGEPANKSYAFRAPPEAANSLDSAGFDLLSLANNHAMDFGPQALIQAIDQLGQSGISVVGAGEDELQAREPWIVAVNEVTIAFLGYVDVPVEVSGFDTKTWAAGANSAGVAWASAELMEQDIASARSRADVVVVLLHSGYEYTQQPSPEQVNAAQIAIDAGANLVIGHHSHLLQGVSFYNGGVIVYGLGNFAFDMEGSRDSAILNVWLDEDGVRNIGFVPVTIGPFGQPGLANEEDADRIRKEIYRLSDLLDPF
jgi:poly-gamma-glutamate synthesis protein (capsule biosynthesis protein)